jgi:hypothetical protein
MKKYEGAFGAAIQPFNKMLDTGIEGRRPIRARVMLDGYLKVTVQANVGHKEANEETGTRKSTTLTVAVASQNQIRRITGFDDMSDDLTALKPGTVITVFGETLYSGNQGQNGFNVLQLHVIEQPEASAEAEHEAETIDEGEELSR